MEPERVITPEETVADYEEFGEHSYSSAQGQFEFRKGETKISFEYYKPNLEDLLTNEKSPFCLQGLDFQTFQIDEQYEPYRKIMNEVRIINKFILENNNSTLDCCESFGLEGKIYFNINKEMMGDSGINVEEKSVGLADDPLTPNGLLTLVHEIGHNKNYEADKEAYHERQKDIEKFNNITNYKSINLSEVDEKVAQSVLEEERGAWATALNDIRPFIKDLDFKPNKIKEFVHHKSLQMYCTYLRMILNAK